MGKATQEAINKIRDERELQTLRQSAAESRLQINRLASELSELQSRENQRTKSLTEFYAKLEDIEQSGADESALTATAAEKVKIEWTDSYHSQCRRARVIVPESWDKPIIFAKGDEQLGHVTCDEDRVKKDIEWVRRNPQCLVFLLGDATDAATLGSPGSIRENIDGPLSQSGRYVQIHKPIADRIIGYVGGNHERRIDKALQEGGAGCRLIAEGLSTDDHKIPYSAGILLIDLHWRGHVWTFTLFHGAGAAATAGSRIQRMQRNMLLADSLITLSGHLHDEAKTSRRFLKRRADGTVKIAKQTALQCGTYLQYIGSYGEVGGMSPTGPDMIVIELQSDGGYLDRFKGTAEF